MKKILKTMVSIVIILMLILNFTMVFAQQPQKPSGEKTGGSMEAPPDKPEGENGDNMQGGNMDMPGSNGSSYLGTINAENSAKSLKITLNDSSTLTLTGDSYITSL